jgi:NADPH:quinone reductase-like Zn-dependent oxidoreductase
MKAITCHNYGSSDVLKYEEIEKPTAGDDEVLIKVRAASVNPVDWHLMEGKPSLARLMPGFGLRKPKNTRVGSDVAGHVEAVGKNVTRLKPGDEVFGVCRGAFAEYGCAPESLGMWTWSGLLAQTTSLITPNRNSPKPAKATI